MTVADSAPSTNSSSTFASDTTFSALGITSDTITRLADAGITVPTVAQAAVVPILLQGLSYQSTYAAAVNAQQTATTSEDSPDVPTPDPPVPVRPEEDVDDVLMFGAETGCGKSLAYLLPFIEAASKAPLPLKAIILVPSRELCAQTSTFLASYFDNAPRHVVLAGGAPPDFSEMRGVQIVIATPSALLNHMRFSRRVDVSDKLIVIDEADMLLTGGFLKDVERILDQPGMKPFATRKNGPLRKQNANRLVFVGATFPHWTGVRVRSIVTWMKRRYPEMRAVQTSALHTRNTRLSSRWYLEETEEDKLSRLRTILREDVSERDKCMVFCSSADGAKRVADQVVDALGDGLADKVGGVAQLHKQVHTKERAEMLQDFRSGVVRLLVCTDLGARGLDLGDVTRVIEFDFATNVVSYLHRIGRTARVGAEGATDHMYDAVSKPLADAIREKAETEATVVASVFSRNRSFRRKWKKNAAASSSVSLGDVEIDKMDAEERRRWEAEEDDSENPDETVVDQPAEGSEADVEKARI